VIKPLTTAKLTLTDKAVNVKVIGCRMDLRERIGDTQRGLGNYEDGKVAGAVCTHGKGQVVAVGFLPGLAYSPFKAGQKTLDEVWPEDPRAIFQLPLALAKIQPVAQASVPVVEANLLTGPAGSVMVLVNYTYQPIAKLKVELQLARAPAKAVSTEKVNVRMERSASGVSLELPLEWTDIILLPNE
jgi:hypothetical protein